MRDVLSPIMGDLAGLRERMYRYYKIKAGDIRDFARLEEPLENAICPALVIFSARIFGGVTDNVISFAEMFQLIYTASAVHENIREDGTVHAVTSCQPRDGCQYPVLVGDYLYSKAFSILVETRNTRHMVRLSEIVQRINEGGILRNKHYPGGIIRSEVWREIIRLEKAELLAGCCQMGAKIAGADGPSQARLYRFGQALGMALGMAGIKKPDQAAVYFTEALACLDQLAPGSDRDSLRDIVLYFMGKNNDSKKMVC